MPCCLMLGSSVLASGHFGVIVVTFLLFFCFETFETVNYFHPGLILNSSLSLPVCPLVPITKIIGETYLWLFHGEHQNKKIIFESRMHHALSGKRQSSSRHHVATAIVAEVQSPHRSLRNRKHRRHHRRGHHQPNQKPKNEGVTSKKSEAT